jgi:crotonobetainyl-CoA:carnitine CoA-transferase CaiB-like acyl-CoA transferase
MLVEMPDRRFGTVTVAGIVPKLSETPGRIRHTGGVIGENTRQVLTELCGLTASEIDGLERRGIVVSFAEPKASV